MSSTVRAKSPKNSKFKVYYVVHKRYPVGHNVNRLRFISLDGKTSYFKELSLFRMTKEEVLNPIKKISISRSCFSEPHNSWHNKIHVNISARMYDRYYRLSSTYLGIWDFGDSLRLID